MISGWCALSLRSSPVWGPLLCCLNSVGRFIFDWSWTWVFFSSGLWRALTLSFSLSLHMQAAVASIWTDNCLVYPLLSSLVVDLCSKNCSSSTDSAHMPHLGGTDAVLSGKSNLCHILLMSCAFNLMLLIDTFLIGLPQCSPVPTQSEISSKSRSVLSWTKGSRD